MLELEQDYILKRNPSYNTGGVAFFNSPDYEQIKEKRAKAIKRTYDNMTKEEKEEIYKNRMGDKNPNFKHGNTAKILFKCPKCEKEYETKYRPKMCNKCSREISVSVRKFGKDNHFYGRRHSEESKRKMRESSLKGKSTGRWIKVRIHGVIYENIKEATKALKIPFNTIKRRIKNKKDGYERLD